MSTKKNLGKQLDLANKRELSVAIICGENEFNDNTVTIKNLKGIKGENNQITFPKKFESTKTKGTIALYRPSNQQLDFEIPLAFVGSKMHIPHKRFVRGRWNITIQWTYEGKLYLYKQKIVY